MLIEDFGFPNCIIVMIALIEDPLYLQICTRLLDCPNIMPLNFIFNRFFIDRSFESCEMRMIHLFILLCFKMFSSSEQSAPKSHSIAQKYIAHPADDWKLEETIYAFLSDNDATHIKNVLFIEA